MMIFALHPMLQLGAILIALFAFSLGLKRFLALHLGKTVRFDWKKHVLAGKLAISLLSLGYLLGIGIIWYRFKTVALFTIHFEIATAMLPLLFFGLLSGAYMDRRKKRRKVLNLVHGLNNTLVLLLCLGQLVVGGRLLRLLFLGY